MVTHLKLLHPRRHHRPASGNSVSHSVPSTSTNYTCITTAIFPDVLDFATRVCATRLMLNKTTAATPLVFFFSSGCWRMCCFLLFLWPLCPKCTLITFFFRSPDLLFFRLSSSASPSAVASEQTRNGHQPAPHCPFGLHAKISNLMILMRRSEGWAMFPSWSIGFDQNGYGRL